jgi:hypothetical protein
MTLEGSLSKMKFLETLLLGQNLLRNLDVILEILIKFTQLERLSKVYVDLQGNPCAEEPYYRLKVIHAIPTLKVFDRHGKRYLVVTVQERIKAAKVMQKVAESNGIAKRQEKTVKPQLMSISTGEKRLAREVKEIQSRYVQEQEEEEKKQKETRFGWEKYKHQPAPRAHSVVINRQNYGVSYENRLTEWEKNLIKPLFIKYDKGKFHIDKTGYLDFEEMKKLIADIRENKAGIGKVPTVDELNAVEIMRKWDRNNDSKIHWREFREGMNNWQWRKVDDKVLSDEIENFYAMAKKEEMSGRSETAKDYAMRALRLEGLDTRMKPITSDKKVEQVNKTRFDWYSVYSLMNTQPQANKMSVPKLII